MRTIEHSGKRVETGALQIGDDWPGIFIRGDNALMGYAPILRAIENGRVEGECVKIFAKGLADLLEECAIHANS